MNRWMLAPLLALATLAATAQVVMREAPANVRVARMVVTAAPQITLNQRVERLSPGARIRDTRNMMVLSASLTGKDVPVLYRKEGMGLVHEVWLLTEDEYSKLGGSNIDVGSPDGARRFNELLAMIFGSRR